MYGRCGSVDDARELFCQLMERNHFSWNIMIVVFAQNGHLVDAKMTFDRMNKRDVVSWTAMITAYSKDGNLREAVIMFKDMPDRNVVSWNTMLAGYVAIGDFERTKKLFDDMLQRDVLSWTSVLAAYASKGSLADVNNMFRKMPQWNTSAGNAMVQVHARNGLLEDARNIFQHMPEHNAASWTAIITAYAKSGHLHDARVMFECIPYESSSCDTVPQKDVISWNAMIQAYIDNGGLQEVKHIFAKMPLRDVVSWTMMIVAYNQNRKQEEAKRVFDRMAFRNVVSWNAMLAACNNVDSAEELFLEMPQRDVVSWNTICVLQSQSQNDSGASKKMFDRTPEYDIVSYTAMIQAYARDGRVDDAKRLFEDMPEHSSVSWTTMLTAFAQNGDMQAAKNTFEEMPTKTLISWNSMIAAYAQHKRYIEAIQLFKQMDLEGVNPDRITFVSVLHACGNLGASQEGLLVMFEIVSVGIQLDGVLATAAIHMYGKCGRLEAARAVFERIIEHDVVSWTAMITAYAQSGYGKEALEMLRVMDQQGWKPDEVTYTSILDACASIAALGYGKMIHNLIVEEDYLKRCLLLNNALLNMYGKCGRVMETRKIFTEMRERDVVSWTTMITTYAQCGHDHANDALELFRKMEFEGINPEGITLISVLSACSHGGLSEIARQYFVSMEADYGLLHNIEHYACMVDALGRAGQLNKAQELMDCMPYVPDVTSWMSFLAACNSHGHTELASSAAKHLMALGVKTSSSYILLSNSSIHARDQTTDMANTQQTFEVSISSDNRPSTYVMH